MVSSKTDFGRAGSAWSRGQRARRRFQRPSIGHDVGPRSRRHGIGAARLAAVESTVCLAAGRGDHDGNTRFVMRLAAPALVAGCSGVRDCRRRLSASAALIANEADGTNWASYGRTYSEEHASPLHEIDGGERRPPRSRVVARAPRYPQRRNGAARGRWRRLFHGRAEHRACRRRAVGQAAVALRPRGDQGRRTQAPDHLGSAGIAYWDGKIYVGTTDGRLIAHRCARRQARLERADRRSRQR